MGKICCKLSGQFGGLDISDQIVKVFYFKSLFSKPYFSIKLIDETKGNRKIEGVLDYGLMVYCTPHYIYDVAAKVTKMDTTLSGENPT
jgi:hypothetical protein